MEDDLEYYITFPTPTPKETQKRTDAGDDDEDDDFVFVNGANGEKEPVVFLLGWLGAEDCHLAKYCGIYNQRGDYRGFIQDCDILPPVWDWISHTWHQFDDWLDCLSQRKLALHLETSLSKEMGICITIRYTSPTSYVFVRPKAKLLPIARKLLALLRDMSLDDHPVFFHMFSNNGSILYYYLTQAMTEDSAPNILVKGCIFDSTPAPRRIYSSARAIYEATPGSLWMKLCASMGMVLYLLSWGILSVLWTIISGKLPNRPPWALIEEPAHCPQLFLYSQADKLISSDDIEFFIVERQKLGVPVVAKCWSDSPHVQHYRVHPEEYRDSVYSFLTMCLSQDMTVKEEVSDTAGDDGKHKSD